MDGNRRDGKSPVDEEKDKAEGNRSEVMQVSQAGPSKQRLNPRAQKLCKSQENQNTTSRREVVICRGKHLAVRRYEGENGQMNIQRCSGGRKLIERVKRDGKGKHGSLRRTELR